MVFVFASAIVLLVILGLSVGLFSSFVPSLSAQGQVSYQRSINPDDEFESIPNQISQSKNEPIEGQILAYENLKKVKKCKKYDFGNTSDSLGDYPDQFFRHSHGSIKSFPT